MDSIKGAVFDIQRYSLHDGEGIRTTVFFKGCPLRCAWCANPESWTSAPVLFFSQARCIKCGCCAAFKGIAMTKEGPIIHRDMCDDIEGIASVCPSGAMIIKGQQMTAKEVVDEVIKDLAFYERSGGGVTLSGGDPLLQPQFAAEILRLCKERGIHTVIETEGDVAFEAFEQVKPYTDQFFFDMKLADSNLHKKYTGTDNTRILHNLEKLCKEAEVCVRIPIIPGVNNTEEELQNIANILCKFNIGEYELLAFHQYGKGKYKSCGIEYPMAEAESMSQEAFEVIKEYFDKIVKTAEGED